MSTRSTVTVANVAPVVDAGVDQSVDEGTTVNLDPSTFVDAGTARYAYRDGRLG